MFLGFGFRLLGLGFVGLMVLGFVGLCGVTKGYIG